MWENIKKVCRVIGGITTFTASALILTIAIFVYTSDIFTVITDMGAAYQKAKVKYELGFQAIADGKLEKAAEAFAKVEQMYPRFKSAFGLTKTIKDALQRDDLTYLGKLAYVKNEILQNKYLLPFIAYRQKLKETSATGQ